MTIETFNKLLEKQPLTDKLVFLKYKYSHERNWTVSNEYLEVCVDSENNYAWLYDWYEGQEEVEIIGFINIDNSNLQALQIKYMKNIEKRWLIK